MDRDEKYSCRNIYSWNLELGGTQRQSNHSAHIPF